VAFDGCISESGHVTLDGFQGPIVWHLIVVFLGRGHVTLVANVSGSGRVAFDGCISESGHVTLDGFQGPIVWHLMVVFLGRVM